MQAYEWERAGGLARRFVGRDSRRAGAVAGCVWRGAWGCGEGSARASLAALGCGEACRGAGRASDAGVWGGTQDCGEGVQGLTRWRGV